MEKGTKAIVTVNEKKVSLDNKDTMIVLSALNKAGYDQGEILVKKGNGVDVFYNDEYQTVHSSTPRVAEITVNGRKASMLSRIKENDVIVMNKPINHMNNIVRLTDVPGYNQYIEFNIDGRDVNLLRITELNKVLTFGDAEIKDRDVVMVRDYYTVSQLREMLDLDEDVVIVKDEIVLDLDDKIYENDEIETYITAIYESFVNGNNSNVELLTGDDFAEDAIMADSELGAEITNSVDEIKEIRVICNGEEVSLNNKKAYAVIDALDAQYFDTSILAGKTFNIYVNSANASFATQICDSDVVELTYDE